MIWRTKLAFKQQGIPTADFITLIAPKARMRALKRFREDASLNVLLLSEMGSHGLDLSFVTHVFLMEQVWDKSLETQVISRAHRMGAEQAVVVEQLWMRGSVESDMAKVNELSEDDITPPRIVHDLGPPVRKLKRKHSSGDALLNVAGKKKRKRDRDDEVAKVPENKRGFLQRKLDYVLNHLKLLDEDIAAPSRQVRFSVVDDKAGTTIRQAIHMIPDTASSTLTSSTTALQHQDTRTTTQPASSTRPTENAGANARTPLRECPAPTVNRREGASNQQHLQGSVMRATAKPVVKRENNAGGTTSARRTAVSFRPQSAREADLSADIPIHSAAATTHRERRSKRPRPDREAIIVIDDQPPAAISMAKQVNPSPEVIVIDDSSSSEPEESFVSENEGVGVDDRDSDRNSDSDSDSNSDSDASVASSSSSNSRSADNEDHFGSDDSGSDSDESDSEGKAFRR
ncbi:hypothetical protein ON010_g18712 [Phytophthora cinnamomi]|nr:hypothetical protein ON010_g18712 [Phytophthora cinnamomi]